MMKTILLVLFLAIGMAGKSQVYVAWALTKKAKKGVPYPELPTLKKTKTVFVYRDMDEPYLDLMQQTLREAWTLTELEFVSYDEFSSNEYGESYSFLQVDYIGYIRDDEERSQYFLTLRQKKGAKWLQHARIQLFPTFNTEVVVFPPGRSRPADREVVMTHLNGSAEIRNWHLAYVKNALQCVQNQLQGKPMKAPEAELKKLRTATLYVPEYCLTKRGLLFGDEVKDRDPDKVMEKYAHPYEIISNEDLGKLVTGSDQPIYYLHYMKSESRKHINVFNSQTGQMVYTVSLIGPKNLTKNDVGALSNAIRK